MSPAGNLSAVLEALRHLPDSAQVTITVGKDDLLRALEEKDDRPEKIVTTAWCSEHLGMSREWWADECRSGRVAQALQEGPGAPWTLPAGAARAHLRRHRLALSGRSRARGPRKARRAS